MTGGRDADRPDCVGRAYTILPEPVTCETELISLFRQQKELEIGGVAYNKTTLKRLGKINKIYAYSFWWYNKSGQLARAWGRRNKTKLEKWMENSSGIDLGRSGADLNGSRDNRAVYLSYLAKSLRSSPLSDSGKILFFRKSRRLKRNSRNFTEKR